MEDDRNPIDDRQARQRVLELIVHLRAFEHALRGHRPVVVVPVGLDGVDVELIVAGPGAIDDAVDEASPEPRGQRRGLPELVPPAPRTHDRLLGAVLRLVRVVDEPGCEVHEAWQLPDERVRELVAPDALPLDIHARTGSSRDQLAFDFVPMRSKA